jgi:hypothetical protein
MKYIISKLIGKEYIQNIEKENLSLKANLNSAHIVIKHRGEKIRDLERTIDMLQDLLRKRDYQMMELERKIDLNKTEIEQIITG